MTPLSVVNIIFLKIAKKEVTNLITTHPKNPISQFKAELYTKTAPLQAQWRAHPNAYPGHRYLMQAQEVAAIPTPAGPVLDTS